MKIVFILSTTTFHKWVPNQVKIKPECQLATDNTDRLLVNERHPSPKKRLNNIL